MFRRSLGSPALFALVYGAIASSVYFSLSIVAGHALGLTPVVFLVSGLFFVLCAMTYVEGASLHQDRGGATIFARYAFNELWSFVAGWAILLDYVILVAVCALAATNYFAAAFWARAGHGALELVIALAVIGYVTFWNIRGVTARRYARVAVLIVADLALQILVVVLGLAILFEPHAITSTIKLGTIPSWSEVIFALTITVVAFTGLESASGLAGEVRVGRKGLRRLILSASGAATVIYVGIALVAISALPVVNGRTALHDHYLKDPLIGVAQAFHPHWLAQTLMYLIGASGFVVLVSAANGAMLGLSRLAHALATNRQIPSAVGRLHPTRATPYVVIGVAGALAAALVAPLDIDFLVGIYAFGALLGFTIAHLAVCALRYREPDRDRPYAMPLSISVRGGRLPLPAVLGALISAAGWVSVVVLHDGARLVGGLWVALGLVLYVVYRTTQEKPLFARVTIPDVALRKERPSAEYGSILVPIFGSALDDDIVQTAGRLVSEDSGEDEGGAKIEALWVFQVPMSLPIDAALPATQLQRARQALRRAKAVGEEYEGVQVETATVRARRTGQAIVDEARRRGVQAIVLAAEEPSRIRAGALLGGRGGPLENYVGEATKYVVSKATCQVILTAAPSSAEIAVPGAQDSTAGDGNTDPTLK